MFRSSLEEDEGVADTEQMQIIEGVDSIDSAVVEEGADQFLASSNNGRSQQIVGDERVM